MNLPGPQIIAGVYGISELCLTLFKRSKNSGGSREDRHSLRVIWVVIGVCIVFAFFAMRAAPQFAYRYSPVLYLSSLALFVFGITWRWYAIYTLGRFFTVDVIVVKDQQVVQHGPYRYLRHPSYLGSLLAFLGLGLCMGNVISLVLCVIPETIVFLWRVRIEEAALAGGLGAAYEQYRQRIWRLIPFIY